MSCWNSSANPAMHKNKIKHALLNTSMKEMGNNCENTQYNVLDKISQTSILWIPTELGQIYHGKKVTLLVNMNTKASWD